MLMAKKLVPYTVEFDVVMVNFQEIRLKVKIGQNPKTWTDADMMLGEAQQMMIDHLPRPMSKGLDKTPNHHRDRKIFQLQIEPGKLPEKGLRL